MEGAGSKAEQRVWAAVPAGTRETLESGLSAPDLQTLLLAVARARAAAVTPARLMRRWQDDRFVRPAASDPRELAIVEGRLWQLLPADVQGVELAPVVPLGACSAVGPVSQNRILSTARSTEVVSDTTNALAIEAAHRRRLQPAGGEVHLAAVQRQLRAQAFGAGAAAHFRLFALVSSARDTGSARTEAGLLLGQVAYWRRVLAALIPTASPRILVTLFDPPALRERLADTVLPALAAEQDLVEVVEDAGRDRGRGYYTGIALRITAEVDGAEIELGDGGLTTWTAQLTGNAKERCLVSCLATERLSDVIRARA